MVVIPAYARMACLNHWIPACACLLQAGRNDGGRIPVFACLLQAGRGQAAEEARKIMPGYL